jgi:DNA-binding LacI/PurR family transcriptional regulator
MSHSLRRLTAAEQTADHLREGIRGGRWPEKLPGVLALAAECDVSPATMRAAIRQLETEGWIHAEGAGKARTAGPPIKDGKSAARRSLRIMVLPGIRLVNEDGAFQQVVITLQHELELSGHVCRIAPKSQEDLKHDVGRIERFVRSHPSDAWVVIGPKRTVVEWFLAQRVPAICIGGEILTQPIAGTGLITIEMFEKVVKHLVGMGHRRILLLWPDYRADLPAEHTLIGALSRALDEVGCGMTSYHVPIWQSTPKGLRETLERAFLLTPPTAIITTYGKWMAGVLSFLAARGLRAPRDISLFSINEDDWFAWKEPAISCLRGDDSQMIRRIVRWMDALTRGKADRRHIGFPMQWVKGGTIGPPAKK